MQVSEVMSPHIRSVEADTSIQTAARELQNERTGLLPVLEGGRMLGVVSAYDIVTRAVASRADLTTTTVRDVLPGRPGVAGRADEPAEEALRRFAEHDVWRMVVVDAGERPVGLLTLADLAAHLEDPVSVAEIMKKMSALQ